MLRAIVTGDNDWPPCKLPSLPCWNRSCPVTRARGCVACKRALSGVPRATTIAVRAEICNVKPRTFEQGSRWNFQEGRGENYRRCVEDYPGELRLRAELATCQPRFDPSLRRPAFAIADGSPSGSSSCSARRLLNLR